MFTRNATFISQARRLTLLSWLIPLMALSGAVVAQERAASPDEAERAAILTLLQRFHDAASGGRAAEAADCLDVSALLDHAVATGLVPSNLLEHREPFLTGLREGVERGLSRNQWSFPGGKVTLRKVEAAAPDRIVAITYTRGTAGYGSTMRWWLHRSGGMWRIGDFEDLDAGMRTSMIMGVTASQMGEGVPPAWVSRFQQLMMAAQRLQGEALEAAEILLDDLEDADFPPMIEALRRMLLAGCYVGAHRTEDALRMTDAAESLHADMPILHYLRAVAWNMEGHHEEALAAARQYLDRVGDDPEGLLQLAAAHDGLGQQTEARAAYERGLREAPDSMELLHAYFWSVPADDDLDSLIKHIQAAPDPAQAFRVLADDAADTGDPIRLESLVHAMSQHLANEPLLTYYLAHVENLRDRPGLAALLARGALSGLTEAEDRAAARRLLWDCQVQLGRAVEAYLEADERDAAFEYMLEECDHPITASERLRLLEARRKDAPDDPFVALRLAQTLSELGEHARCYEVLVAHREAITTEEDYLVAFEDGFIRTCLFLGKADEALAIARESTDRDDDPFFEVIVYAWKGDVRGVMAAMEVCVEDFGYDPTVFYHDADVGAKLRGPAFKPVREKFPPESSDW